MMRKAWTVEHLGGFGAVARRGLPGGDVEVGVRRAGVGALGGELRAARAFKRFARPAVAGIDCVHDDRLHLPIWSPTADDFAACDLEGPIADIDHVGMAAISTAYAFASLSVPSPCKEVYGLLSDVTGIHLDPADRGEKWKRSAPFAGRHPIMPADICGELADVLEAILPRIRNAALRARVTDVVWSGDNETARLHHAARRRGRSRRNGCVSSKY